MVFILKYSKVKRGKKNSKLLQGKNLFKLEEIWIKKNSSVISYYTISWKTEKWSNGSSSFL